MKNCAFVISYPLEMPMVFYNETQKFYVILFNVRSHSKLMTFDRSTLNVIIHRSMLSPLNHRQRPYQGYRSGPISLLVLAIFFLFGKKYKLYMDN